MSQILPLALAIFVTFIISPVIPASPSTSSSLSSSASRSTSTSSKSSQIVEGGKYNYHDIDYQRGYSGGEMYNPREMGGYLKDWNHRMHQPKCVDIPDNLTLCQNIGYEQMILPNLLDHDSLREVTQQAKSWVHLVNINCHPDLKVFLCSLFSPVCLDKIIYPCRTLCSSVKASCETRMKAYGFDWPEMLACSKYPEDNDMCITLIHDVKRDNNCSACKHPLTYEALIDHFCRADIVMRVTVKEIRDLHGDSSLIMRKKKRFFKTKEGISKKVARELKVIIKDGATCTCDTVEATQQRYLVMGYKSDDKLMLNFAMPWDKNNKEFKKGIRAIKKKRTCEGIFQELSNNGSSLDPGASAKATGSRRGRGGKQNRRQKGRKKGNRKNRRKGKGKGKGKGRKRRVRKGKKMRKRGKNQRKQRRGSATPTTSSKPSGQGMSITEIEDRALSNFRRASN